MKKKEEGIKENEKATDDVLTVDYPLIVIGASAGGLEVIKGIISSLPKDLNASIFIVWHMSATTYGILPQVLNRYNTLYASHPYDGELIRPQRIYVAPPDRHLLIGNGVIRVTRGPKENRFRPAIDPLFRSAAFYYGQKVIGVILSGGLDDGTAGLWTIKHFGGTAIVQDPTEALVKGMPESAMREVATDLCLLAATIPDHLIRLVEEKTKENAYEVMEKDDKILAEIMIASEENALDANIMQYGELSPFTCPECHGVLTALRDGMIQRYRCHTGHAYSPDSLLEALTENIENSLYDAIRGVDESIFLLNHLGDHFAELNQTKLAAVFFKKASEAAEKSTLMRRAVLNHEQLNKQSIADELKK